MISLLKSDFYKLFKRKSFYICGIITVGLGMALVALLNQAGLGPYDGAYAARVGLGQVALLSAIFISMFVPSEFGFGTIKNISSRGISRVKIYFSKLIVSFFVPLVYALTSMICSFILGVFIWNNTSFTNAEPYIELLKSFGLFMLAEISLQALLVAVGFIVRNTGGTMAINLGIYIAVGQVILPIIDLAIIYFFPELNVTSSDYWVGTYTSAFIDSYASLPWDRISKGIIVCLSYLIGSTAIGAFSFSKRDIK